ncbi:hypothetical protein ACFQ3S_17160 [Mucilaginibacter terrae]|uniref:hypothetical protein n=1 Tax=Mucilaginibacter terrae TaxID=1955052 RepID=UPI0036434B60
MNKVKSYLLVALLSMAINALSQVAEKPVFKQLTFATYESFFVGKVEKAEIIDLLEIDAFGKVHYRSKYYNGVADTVYHLNNKTIKKLNKIFNGKTRLKSYLLKTKLEEGSHYGGDFDYLSYVDSSNQSDEIIVVNPFMTKEFNDALDGLGVPPHKTNKKVSKIQDKILSARILRCQKSTNYLPKIELPPDQMN